MMTATNYSVSIQKHDDDGILVSAEGSDLSNQKANPFVSVSNRLPEKVSIFICELISRCFSLRSGESSICCFSLCSYIHFQQLMTVLDSAVYSHIFAWTKSGRSISIYKPYDLVSDVLTTHFDAKSDMKFDSFLRKVSTVVLST